MKVGRHTYGAETIVISFGDEADLEIGAFCSIASNVKVWLGGNHHSEWVSTFPFDVKFPPAEASAYSRGPIHIGNDVWVGSGVTIISAVTIGDGAVIANGSHVVKDVGPYEMVGGNPAQLIRVRFPVEVVARLLAVKWWDWTDEKVREAVPLLCSPDVEAFLQYAERI